MTLLIRIQIILLVAFLSFAATAQERPLSQLVAATAMATWPDSFVLENDKFAKWRYDQGVILKGIEGIWNATGEGKWFNYIRKSMDFYVQEDGTIKGYRPDEYNIDHVNNGKLLLLLFQVTGKEKYKKAADLLRSQLRTHPRTTTGGFWHKKIYPWQMWLDGLYMGQPFYAEYAKLFHEDTIFNDVARQFILMEKFSRDTRTGLLYHGWDESHQQRWADKSTGRSPNFWSRSLGWYGMALVDVLDHFPAKHPRRAELVSILNRLATALRKVQDRNSGVWYDVPDKPGLGKNYLEASASCMLAYTFAKGARKGYLPAVYLDHAKQAYRGIIKEFIETDSVGRVNLKGTVAVSGLGGNPYRDGSFEYYMNEPVIDNDPKGLGAFIKCAVEMELNETTHVGKGKTVLLDYYFNNEWKNDITGREIRWHYTWEDKSNSGYAMLGDLFNRFGVKTISAETFPQASLLKQASVYIIVDPDTDKESAKPHYISQKDADAITEWVKAGGVLVLLGNDAGNAEFKNLNLLAKRFGIQFNEDSRNRVLQDQFEQGAVITGGGNPVFTSPRKLFIKEYSSLEVSSPAITVLRNGQDHVMAVSSFGKGTVFALGDPWIYNEYLDGRKLPDDYENYKAAEDWVKWLINQAGISRRLPSAKNVAPNSNPALIKSRIVVAHDGSGDYKTVQGAINSLPDSSSTPRIIYIRKGIYREKIYIEKSNILFEGEDREGTVITASIARDEWRCGHADDWGVATMNVGGNDITLKNLTITNSFGFDYREERTIHCPSDTVNHQRKLAKNGHQMALRTLHATRLKAINCHFRAFGGDTVSPWEVNNGLWYFRDCIMEGGVDFYCPRGWAWAENCEFISHNGTAAIWHDGSGHEDSKTVLKNCRFRGYDGFLLGRYHRDAQFYLIDCVFAGNMRDSAIYRVPTANNIQWGHRVYYYNCHREGGNDFSWYGNNLPAGLNATEINVKWVFKNRWYPAEN